MKDADVAAGVEQRLDFSPGRLGDIATPVHHLCPLVCGAAGGDRRHHPFGMMPFFTPSGELAFGR